MKILVAYDGSAASDAAIDTVLHRPWPADTEVRLLMVLETPLLYPMGDGIEVYPMLTEQATHAAREQASARLRTALERLRKGAPGLRADSELREGVVKTTLLAALKEWGADLAIVGSHGHRALGRLFLGSVSHALVTHAPCNVEVVRAAGALA